MNAPAYLLGNATHAEHRLTLLNELTADGFVAAIKSHIPGHKVRVLNLGCGSGHLEELLAPHFSNSHFVGIDINPRRIEEARARAKEFISTNSYEFIVGDITTFSPDALEPVDILISRAVLSHLANPLEVVDRFLPRVKQYFCFEEAASNSTEYYCNKKNEAYESLPELIEVQKRAQASSFQIGFDLLTTCLERSYEVVHSHISEPLLLTARHKAIWRLGVEDAPASMRLSFLKFINSFAEFENDPQAFGTYLRTVAVIAKLHASRCF